MNKRSVSASILVLFLALVFAVIGACFSSFVYKDKMIKFEEIKVIASSGIDIFEDKEYSKQTDKLKLSKMELGLKPATGELDAETKIPSTVTDDGTSEGYYEKLYVKADSAYKILIKNITVENKKDKSAANKERENIFVAIKDVKNSTKSLEKDIVEIASISDGFEQKELVFMFWLSSFSGKELVGSKISFDVEFVTV